MARLPIPGSDDGKWGRLLNEYLSQSHDESGLLKHGSVSTVQLADGSVTSEKIASGAVTKNDVGLGNVDDTSDQDKPISIASQSALDMKLASADLDAAVAAELNNVDSASHASYVALTANLTQTHTAVLAPWFSKLMADPGNAKIATIGDSTRDAAVAGMNWHNAVKRHMAIGAGLAGMIESNLLNFGVNGASIATITSTERMASLATALPDLIEVSMGINDIRATPLSITEMATIIETGINKIRAACPGVPIVASVPNSFNTTADAGNYISPNSEAAAKSITLRAAWLSLTDRWPDVIVRDTYDTFGPSKASSPYLSDQIHPNSSGGHASAAGFVNLVGYSVPADRSAISAARSSNPYDPWIIYGRELEDPERYLLIAEGDYVGGTAGSHVDFTYNGPRLQGEMQAWDLILLPNGNAFRYSGSVADVGGVTSRILSSLVPSLSGLVGGGKLSKVRVYRRRLPIDAAHLAARRSTAYFYKRTGVITTSATNNTNTGQNVIDVAARSMVAGEAVSTPANEWAAQLVNGDRIYIDGLASIDPATGDYFTIGTNATAGTNGATLRLSGIAQLDRAALFGRQALVVGTHS